MSLHCLANSIPHLLQVCESRHCMIARPMEAVQDLKSFRMPPGFRRRSAVYVQIWWLVQTVFFRASPQFMYPWRRFLLRAFGAKVGRGVLIRPSASVTYPWTVSIGDY